MKQQNLFIQNCSVLIFFFFAFNIFQANAQYCTPSYLAGCDDGTNINSVTLNGENGTSLIDLNTGCSPSAYEDKTSLPAVQLYSGTVYQINISTEMNQFITGTSCAIWIDFNDNNSFEPGEKVAVYNGLLSLTGTNVSLSIPSGSNLGTHRMRIVAGMGMLGANTADDMDPCPNFSNGAMNGEAHDYQVQIVNPGPPCSNPVVNLGPDKELCTGQSVVLDAGNPGLSYLWNTGATTQTISVNTPGTYSVTVSDGACSGADTVQVIASSLPTVGSINANNLGNGSFTFSAVGANNVNTYSWNFGDGNTGTGATVNHTYNQIGNYTVLLTVGNGCGQEQTSVDVNVTTTQIKNLIENQNSILTYPQPAENKLQIQIEGDDLMQHISVFDLSGRNIFNAEIQSTAHYVLDCSQLSNGFYLLQVQTKNKKMMAKFVVQK